ncbi:hypothetical protein [Candidatus Protochlamydia sp. R18]|uniref:hypothetical protein n=1 Tax=Candidatus Protochlamydia sp. R18 TaxID=1353977 RepID=UPI0005AB7F5E|nr:hypothetical protein [Candidatus Protochlamydia sp. R18]
MNFQQVLTSTQSFVKLEPVINQASDEISFWGKRYIYIQRYKQDFPLHDLVACIIEIVIQKEFEFSPEEREAGRKIAAKINQLYQNNDNKLENKNLITRQLCKLRDAWLNWTTPYYSPRFKWEHTFNNFFEYYTKKQYIILFGCEANNSDQVIRINNSKFVQLYSHPT